MFIRSVRRLFLCFTVLSLSVFIENSFAANTPTCAAGPIGDECGFGGHGGGGGGSPLTVLLKNDLLDRELAPWSCSLNTARNALVSYLETIEDTSESLNVEHLSSTDPGETIATASVLELQVELPGPWSNIVKSFGFIYKQLAETNEEPVQVDQSHVFFLVKCDTQTGDTRLTSLRGKYFGSLGLRSEYVIKFEPSGFSRADAEALAYAQLESCESAVDSVRYFALPGSTRLIEALELITTTNGEACGNPPIASGRTIVVTAEQDLYIYDSTSGLDITGKVEANVSSGPYTGNPSSLDTVSLSGITSKAVYEPNDSYCYTAETGASGEGAEFYRMSNPSSPTGSLTCSTTLPQINNTQAACFGLPDDTYVQVEDKLTTSSYPGLIITHGACQPGDQVDYLFNPISLTEPERERQTAITNVFYYVKKARDWAISRGLEASVLDALPLKANVNVVVVDEDGDPSTPNCDPAEYEPGSKTMNFARKGTSLDCYNMAFDSPIYHEYGHHLDNLYGPIDQKDNIERAMSEGWGDLLSGIMTGSGWIGFGMYQDPATHGYFLRSISDDALWFPPQCLIAQHPGSICGVGNNEPCDCSPAVACDSAGSGTEQEILTCRRYLYGDVWASIAFELWMRLKSENGGDGQAVEELILSTLMTSSPTIADALSLILQIDTPVSRTALTASPHLCTIQSVANKFGFDLVLIDEHVPEFSTFDGCYLKTYSPTSNPNDKSMFNSLIRDDQDNFYASGYYQPEGHFRRYFQKKIDADGAVVSDWQVQTIKQTFPGLHDRAKATLDLGNKYLVSAYVGSPTNLPGGNMWMAEIDKTHGSLSKEIGPFGSEPNYDENYPQVQDGIQSIQPLSDGTFIITGLTQTFQETETVGGPANCTPEEPEGYEGPPYPSFTPCGDAFVGFLDTNADPEVGPAPDYKPFDIQVVGGDFSDIFHEAKEISNGDVIVAGSLVGATRREAVLIRTDVGTTGNRSAPDPAGDAFIKSETDNTIFRDFIEVKYAGAPSGFLAVGFTEDSDENQKILVTRINASLDNPPVWENTYQNQTSNYLHTATSVRQYVDESGFLIAGTHNYNVVLLKVDNSGNQVWCKKYTYFRTDEQGPNLEPTADGTGFLIAGQYKEPSFPYSKTAAVMRITLDGDAPTRIQSCNYGAGPPAPRKGRTFSSVNLK